ncbi:tryptophan dimethylallyltransferase family protein [Streptomyces sp. NPDC053560]|uniref:tryptophan dimethylallyltransferase family protein n=1 Tax=Streptomyces sp. NPDC053560 TaxID=3365711 RepID=UPI0037D41958
MVRPVPSLWVTACTFVRHGCVALSVDTHASPPRAAVEAEEASLFVKGPRISGKRRQPSLPECCGIQGYPTLLVLADGPAKQAHGTAKPGERRNFVVVLRTESRAPAGVSFVDYGVSTLARLLDSAGMDAEHGTRVLRGMLTPWGGGRIGERPHWHSDVCADGSPIEFSAAFSRHCREVRVLVEALPDRPTTPAAQESATELTRILVQDFGADGDRLAKITDLFLPDEEPTGFAMMHAVVFTPTGRPEFKVYLNPNASRGMSAVERTHEALDRLGFGKAWTAIADYADRGFDLDRIVYVSLDLADGPESRVKVYFRHYDVTPEYLDTRMEISAQHERGFLGEFCRKVTGRAGEVRNQPLVSNLTFAAAGGHLPVSATLYVPLWVHAENDRTVRDRISAVMAGLGLPDSGYRALLDHVARRPLPDGRGIHTYASARVQHGLPRVTTYWSSELYDRYPPARYQRG